MTAMGITSAKMTVKMTIASSDDNNCIHICIIVCSTRLIDKKAGYIMKRCCAKIVKQTIKLGKS